MELQHRWGVGNLIDGNRSAPQSRCPQLETRDTHVASVWLARKDERCAGDDRRAGADERHLDILDLTRTGATGGLEGALDDVPQAVNAPRAQAATKRIQRQLAVKRNPTALNKVEGLALLAEAVGLKAVNHGRRKAVVDLGDVDVLRRRAGAFPGELGRARTALHVVGKAADSARYFEMQALAVAGKIGRRGLQVPRPLGCRQYHRNCALHRDVAVVKTKRIGHHARVEIVLPRQRRAVEKGAGVVLGVLSLDERKRYHLVATLVIALEVARVGHCHVLTWPAEAERSGELGGASRLRTWQVLVGALGVVHRPPNHGVSAHASKQCIGRLLDGAPDVVTAYLHVPG